MPITAAEIEELVQKEVRNRHAEAQRVAEPDDAALLERAEDRLAARLRERGAEAATEGAIDRLRELLPVRD